VGIRTAFDLCASFCRIGNDTPQPSARDRAGADCSLWLLGWSVFFIRGFFLLQRKRLILSTPTSTVRGAAMGRVEVFGKMLGPYTLLSPLSQTECLYYKAEAWQQVGGNEKRWSKVAEEQICVPLFLEDDTGRVAVDPRGR
jgi:hypothetical protein